MALAFITLGRSISLGSHDMVRSIFSPTSMNSKSISAPGSKVSLTVEASIRLSLLKDFNPGT